MNTTLTLRSNRLRVVLASFALFASLEAVALPGCLARLLRVDLDPKITLWDNRRIGLQLVDPNDPAARGKWLTTVMDLFRRPLGVETLNLAYQRFRHDYKPGDDVFGAWLRALRIGVHLPPEQFAEIPATGPVVVTSNHPLSGVDGLAVAHALRQVRTDVKIVLTAHLSGMPGVAEHSIMVDVQNGNNAHVIPQATEWLQGGHALLIFPAGEVSARQPNGEIVDRRWRSGAARMAKSVNAPVLPIFVAGRPTESYLSAYAWHHTLGAAMVLREVGHLRGKTVALQVGERIDSDDVARMSVEQLTAAMRARTYAASGRR